ncbi:hypothetical protein PTSG_00811 [Salpingoeca rosetta]|uniref:Uncharacterized protein n=1 Tax=Salpingoeca rosetta (strain ATCC 50818 / BSB-021) TaxID=946362 RepID=F2TXJ6_SALR5|nr:uncharacterized protein PTSG_00811 [Salpingoeca rosetta]EGD76105.1 hypothetical protein PTSG_00811 [Salpingoeca rosetta]|eukprot:XP_004998280.1 hypothetical protein PTSG_00811 [Salpingoeca rosetta]
MRVAGALLQQVGRRGVIAVRRETKNRWERRAPLVPKHVRKLKRMGFRVLVQPSDMRVFTNEQYARAGAELVEDLSAASVVLGVKEVPLSELHPNKTYVCFSHTIKAQEGNMGMLDDILSKNIRLIDYECMLDENKKRVIGFGKFAGIAGMIDLLRGLGDRLLGLGYSNPFLGMGYMDYFHSVAAAKTALQLVGNNILINGTPKAVAPMIFGFTGTGNVTQGALEIFEQLPHEYITAKDLEVVIASGDPNTLYGIKLQREDLVQHKDPTQRVTFDKNHYNSNPDEYEPIFHTKIAPHISALVHGMYWDARFPRLLTCDQMRALHNTGTSRLIAIADISADPNGSIEFTRECTTIDRPYEVYNPNTDTSVFDWEAEGILLGSVDNLPAEIPVEASIHFGDLLVDYIPELARSDMTLPFEQQTDIGDTLRNAIITAHGKLTPRYEYIANLRRENEELARKSAPPRVVVLGSGLVCPSYIDSLLKVMGSGKVDVTVVGAQASELKQLANAYDTINTVELDVTDDAALRSVIGTSDVVVSLLPASLHLRPAKLCLELGKDMVTTSYVSDEMAALHDEAREKGLVFLNECGLDPGIDHFKAMDIIHRLSESNMDITSFTSWCGGLPAIHCANNPLGYKFSWSPRGVLVAAKNAARYREHGAVVDVESGTLPEHARDVQVGRMQFVGTPNRDSVKYESVYGLDKSGKLECILRGTLRYTGFWEALRVFTEVGLLREDIKLGASTARDLIAEAAKAQPDDVPAETQEEALRMLAECGVGESTRCPAHVAPLDALSALLTDALAYQRGERDMIVLTHSFTGVGSGSKTVQVDAELSYMGGRHPMEATAMATTVGAPGALATKYVLNKNECSFLDRGVLRPTNVQLSQQFLKDLDKYFDISFNERVIES